MAIKQELHLEILNREYSRFVKDQVLTEVQLNEIIDVFEEQHRLTRTCLIGTGIVCGLHLSEHLNLAGNIVTLSPGVAVTTDGDLLAIPHTTSFKYITKYVPPDNCHYDPFYYKESGVEKMVTLYQLLTEEEKNSLNSEKTVYEIKELSTIIKDWVAILYLEYYLKNPEKCTPINCDNMGMRQVSRPKVLVMSKTDMDKVIHKDSGENIGDDIYLKYHEAYDRYFTFPVLRARRIILNSANTLTSTTLAGAYFTATRNGCTALSEAIKKLYTAFRFLIDKGGVVNIDTLTGRLTTALSTATNTLHGQYTYDFYKDVVVAYNELREVLYNVAFECCPNIYAFPKHIMLGAPNIAYGPQPPEYRHHFYPSPAVSKNKVQVNVAIGMLNRLKLIIENFTPDTANVIKITPTRDYNQPLAERAIPFYFKNIGALSKEWNYSRNLKAQDKLNLSYNADQYDAPIPDEARNPLDYDLDPYNFFRIEGHIGKDFSSVLKNIEDIRSSKGLPFDVVALRLGDVKLSDINLNDFVCYFEDLNTMLQAFQAEINCLLSDGTRFFSGFTLSQDQPHINIKLYQADEGLKWVIADTLLKAESATESAQADVMRAVTRSAKATPAQGSTRNVNLADRAANFSDALTRSGFAVNRIVTTKIDQNPETFGQKYFINVLKSEPVSVDEFVEQSRKQAATDVGLKALVEDERVVRFEYPMQIIGHLNYIQQFIPAGFGDINDALITGYRDFSQTFCKRLKVMHTRLEGFFTSGQYASRGYESSYLNMLVRLQGLCCGYEKLEVIMREIEKRKAELLQRISFARYAEQHPGLEHKAGVHRGGTFVLVYAASQTPRTSQQLPGELQSKNNITDAGRFQTGEITAQQYRDTDAFALYIVSNEDSVDKEVELSSFLSFQKIRPGSPASESLIREMNTKIGNIRQVFSRNLNSPAQDIVIADFCLPYLCCSDCPPVAFMVPKEIKALALPASTVCYNQQPIPFSLYSPKGAVIASPEAPGSIIAGDKPSFDPGKVPVDNIGKPITFTLDGALTDCSIIVKKPVDIRLDSRITDSGDGKFSVEFINKTDETLGKNTYLWRFNGDIRDVTKSDLSSFTLEFSRSELKAQGIKTILATVTIPGDPCGSSETLIVDVPAQFVVDACKDFVLDFITDKAGELKIDSQTVINLKNSLLSDVYQNAIISLNDAKVAVEKNDQNLKAACIEMIAKLLDQIYQFRLTAEQQEAARILEKLLRVLMMLMLNLVRCDKEIPGPTFKIIHFNLSQFNEKLMNSYPQLDFGNVLEKDINDYSSSFASQNQDLLSVLGGIIKILSGFPES